MDTPANETQPPPDVPPPGSKDDQNLAVIAHLLGIFLGFIGPLIIYLIKNQDSGSFARAESAEALNFQITMLFAWIIAGVLSCLIIGLFLMPVIWLVTIIFCIIAAVTNSKGEPYRYPFAIRLIS